MIKDDLLRQTATGIFHEGKYGIEIEAETKEPYVLPKFHYWDVKPDNSLRDFGQEYVLKAPLNYGDQLTEGLMEFHDKTRNIPFIQDSNSTSVHVHCNILPETWKTVANFLTIYTLTENLLMEVAGDSRRNNLFCLPIKSVPYINKLSVDIFRRVLKKSFNFSPMMDFNTVKYAALNLATMTRFGSLEIRSFRGVTDIEVIQAWVDILERMWDYARNDVTPPVILDSFRDKGKPFLKKIFQNQWKELNHKDADKLLMDNLWFAGQFAYQFEPSVWKKLDDKPKPLPVPEGMTIEELDKHALQFYGQPYDTLNTMEQDKVIKLVWLSKGKTKRKSVFTINEIHNEVTITTTPPALEWSSVSLNPTSTASGGQT